MEVSTSSPVTNKPDGDKADSVQNVDVSTSVEARVSKPVEFTTQIHNSDNSSTYDEWSVGLGVGKYVMPKEKRVIHVKVGFKDNLLKLANYFVNYLHFNSPLAFQIYPLESEELYRYFVSLVDQRVCYSLQTAKSLRKDQLEVISVPSIFFDMLSTVCLIQDAEAGIVLLPDQLVATSYLSKGDKFMSFEDMREFSWRLNQYRSVAHLVSGIPINRDANSGMQVAKYGNVIVSYTSDVKPGLLALSMLLGHEIDSNDQSAKAIFNVAYASADKVDDLFVGIERFF